MNHPPRPAHTHTWDGTTAPAWLRPDQHHYDNGELVIHTPDGHHARPRPGWTLIGWTDHTVTVASPAIAEREYGPTGVYQQLTRAEAERDVARQHSATIAAQRDRLRQRMNALAERWDLQGPPPGNRPLTELRAEISVAPFNGEHTVVQSYRADDHTIKWAARCWGTETCDGWLSLDHDTERWAEIARDRHVAQEHVSAGEAQTPTEDTVTCVTALYEQWVKSGPPPIGTLTARWWDTRLAELHTALHTTQDQR
ncbi:hypothetical protein ACFXPN_29645 [Streptomyces griseorubiginosus]|uniref:hypothetical protein n=1 Tax=Streptomyces griseorubiginosus TaxID=67304 RepID=UPI0036B6F666